MSSEELHELHEHAEHASHDRKLAPVSLTMAVLAVLVATVSLLGHRAHTEEVVLQNRASDQWAYFQAKNIRRHADEQLLDLDPLLAIKDEKKQADFHAKYQAEAARYGEELKEAEAEARRTEAERDTQRRRADRFDLGEVFLEIGLVITSVTLLSGRRAFWRVGIVLGVVGLAVGLSGLLLT
jgi:hypothetical protein